MTQEDKRSLIPQELYANAYGNLYENKEDLPNYYEKSCARVIHLGAVKIEIKPL